MSIKSVICLGAAVWDTILQVSELPSGGGKILPTRAVQLSSGMATAAAIAIARMGKEQGVSVSLWGRVGDDVNGQSYLHGLNQQGVATDFVRLVQGGQTAFSTIVVDAQGERLVLPYYDPQLDASVDWLPLNQLSEASAVHCDMRWPQGSKAVLQAARRAGVPSILDADVAPLDDLRELIPLADHLLFSQAAFELLEPTGSLIGNLKALAKRTQAQVVGVTLGAEGALILRCGSDEIEHYPGFEIDAADTLNAGDVWHGTYTLGVVSGWDLSTRVMAANLAAAIKCESFGGWSGAPDMKTLCNRARMLGVSGVDKLEDTGALSNDK